MATEETKSTAPKSTLIKVVDFTIDKLIEDGTYSNLSKRELLQVTRQRAKLEKNLGSISDLTRLPSALFVVDVMKEHIAVAEANRLGIPVFGIVDTNSNPDNIDFVIPANDDASSSVEAILNVVCAAINEGLEERKAEIGVRLAFGATKGSIMKQILWENMLLTCIGGVAGLMLTYLLVYTGAEWVLTIFDSGDSFSVMERDINADMLFNPYIFITVFINYFVCI